MPSLDYTRVRRSTNLVYLEGSVEESLDVAHAILYPDVPIEVVVVVLGLHVFQHALPHVLRGELRGLHPVEVQRRGPTGLLQNLLNFFLAVQPYRVNIRHLRVESFGILETRVIDESKGILRL